MSETEKTFSLELLRPIIPKLLLRAILIGIITSFFLKLGINSWSSALFVILTSITLFAPVYLLTRVFKPKVLIMAKNTEDGILLPQIIEHFKETHNITHVTSVAAARQLLIKSYYDVFVIGEYLPEDFINEFSNDIWRGIFNNVGMFVSLRASETKVKYNFQKLIGSIVNKKCSFSDNFVLDLPEFKKRPKQFTNIQRKSTKKNLRLLYAFEDKIKEFNKLT